MTHKELSEEIHTSVGEFVKLIDFAKKNGYPALYEDGERSLATHLSQLRRSVTVYSQRLELAVESRKTQPSKTVTTTTTRRGGFW